MSEETAPRRSPLPHRPLRYAGQSLDEEIDLQRQKALTYIVVSGACAAVVLAEWLAVIIKSPTKPWIPTALTVLIGGYSAIRLWRIQRRLRNLELGRDGERIVAEELDILKKEGASVLHDIVGEGFNVDHVVCCPQGVFLIETKTRSVPTAGKSTVVYDGSRVLVNGIEADRDAIRQASALASWLEKTLLGSTGRRFAVRPVVVFPGWFVEPGPKGAAVWVLNPKALPAFIRHEPVSIDTSDVHLITFHLSRYIRAH
jgi:hypothetical protein